MTTVDTYNKDGILAVINELQQELDRLFFKIVDSDFSDQKEKEYLFTSLENCHGEILTLNIELHNGALNYERLEGQRVPY